MAFLYSARLKAVVVLLSSAVAAAALFQPTEAKARNGGVGIAAGIVGAAIIGGIIANQAAQAHRQATAPSKRPRVKKTKSKVRQPAPTEAQAQVARPAAPPPMNSDPFRGVAPTLVPSASAKSF